MAKPTMKDLKEAYERGVKVGQSDLYDEELIANIFEEWLGEDRVDLLGEPDDTEDEVLADIEIAYAILRDTRQELIDSAHSGNLERDHHLEDAVVCFEDIGTLFKAQRIIRQVLDPRDSVGAPTEN